MDKFEEFEVISDRIEQDKADLLGEPRISIFHNYEDLDDMQDAFN